MTNDGVMQVASLDDLMAHKLKVILQRLEKKDYLDIAAMLVAGVALERGLAAARQLFRKAIQSAESLMALTWLKDWDLPSMPAATRNFLIAAAFREFADVLGRAKSRPASC